MFGGVLRRDLMQARSIRSELNIHPKLCLKEVYLMFWIELLIVLVMIFIGTRKGGPFMAPVSYTHLTLPTN